jgi:hypothetical protein
MMALQCESVEGAEDMFLWSYDADQDRLKVEGWVLFLMATWTGFERHQIG